MMSRPALHAAGLHLKIHSASVSLRWRITGFRESLVLHLGTKWVRCLQAQLHVEDRRSPKWEGMFPLENKAKIKGSQIALVLRRLLM